MEKTALGEVVELSAVPRRAPRSRLRRTLGLHGLLRRSDGYSLVEVLVAIVILTVAILPMVSMFDVGLKSADESGTYDEARTLANEKLEQAKSLPYDSTTATDLKDNFPYSAPTTKATDGTTTAAINSTTDTSVPNGMSYTVRKQFLRMTTSGTNANLSAGSATAADGLIEVQVTVSWEDNSYTATSVVARGTLS